jgi:hypothetical protein
MAFNLTPATLSALASVASVPSRIDVVAVLDQDTLQQVFEGARPMKAMVRETAMVMKYPVETGATLSDHRISNPTEIEMTFVIPSEQYAVAYQDIRNAWVNATKLSVQTRTGTYQNMIIADMPHEEDPDSFNTVTQHIRFMEVIYAAPASIAQPSGLANYQPADPQYAMTVNRGLLTGITAPAGILSYFSASSIWGL